MYILELIKINKKEDLFFEDSDYYKNFADEINAFHKQFDEEHKDLFYKKEVQQSYKREKLVDGSYRNIKYLKFFKTKDDVKKYMYDLFEHTQPINWTPDGVKYYTPATSEEHKRTIEFHAGRQFWTMSHEIYNEMNILDTNYKFVECITSCSQNICIKYGGCKPGISCESQEPDNPIFKKENISYHHISVDSIIKKRSKPAGNGNVNEEDINKYVVRQTTNHRYPE
jgi:hypothetical protein